MNITSEQTTSAIHDAASFLISMVMQWMSTPNFMVDAANFAVFIIVIRLSFLALRWSIRKARHNRQRRMARMFAADQKKMGHRRAGNQCEFSVGMGRCTNRSEHGDHFYPHSRGGATSMQNFVAACSGHNLSKGAKMPSGIEKARIEKRRKRYFAALTSTRAGEWA